MTRAAAPVLIVRFLPELRCDSCGAIRYVEAKSHRCTQCWSIMLELATRRQRASGNPPAVSRQ